MMNAFRHLFKLYAADGTLLATLTAGNEASAREAYAADNRAARDVARAEQIASATRPTCSESLPERKGTP